MTIFGQYKEKLKGIGGRMVWVKFRRNYEDLETSLYIKNIKLVIKFLKLIQRMGSLIYCNFFYSIYLFLAINLKSELSNQLGPID